MKRHKAAVAGGLAVAMIWASASAQQPIITSFPGNGALAWTNLPATNGFTVQWAPAVTGPWSTNWQALDSLVSTGAVNSVSVPMFYRVAQGFAPSSLRGVWIMVGGSGATANNYFIAQDDGTLSETGMFNMKHPAGYFSISTSGTITATFVGDDSGAATGIFAGANLINFGPPLTNFVAVSRLDDTTRCAGTWTGALSQTNGPGTPISYPVSFIVDARGLATSFTGFAGPCMGRFFALSSGAAVGFVSLGKSDGANGAYWEISLSGTLAGNTFSGSYGTDSGDGASAVLGAASFTRQ